MRSKWSNLEISSRLAGSKCLNTTQKEPFILLPKFILFKRLICRLEIGNRLARSKWLYLEIGSRLVRSKCLNTPQKEPIILGTPKIHFTKIDSSADWRLVIDLREVNDSTWRLVVDLQEVNDSTWRLVVDLREVNAATLHKKGLSYYSQNSLY